MFREIMFVDLRQDNIHKMNNIIVHIYHCASEHGVSEKVNHLYAR